MSVGYEYMLIQIYSLFEIFSIYFIYSIGNVRGRGFEYAETHYPLIDGLERGYA